VIWRSTDVCASLAGLWQQLRRSLTVRAKEPGVIRSALAAHWLQWQRRFDAFSLRERVAVAVAVCVVALAIWDRYLMESLNARIRDARGRLDTVAPEGAESEAALTDLDQLVELEKKLTMQYQRKRYELDSRAASLVDPSKMPDVLTSLIRSSHGLRLVRLANLPVEELKAPATDTGGDAPAATADTADTATALADIGGVPAVAFVHGIELVVEGDFESIHDYVRLIERQDRQLMWRKIELDASEYPKVTARIVVATLGLEKHWLTI
jgi:MSHA biogenesis protein MshJ